MKFTIQSETLSAALNWLLKVVPSKTAMPVTESIRFDAAGGKLTATATDGEATLVVPLETKDVKDGTACIPASILGDFIKALPGGMELVFDDNGSAGALNRMVVTYAGGKAELCIFDADTWPAAARVEDDEILSVDGKRLGKALAIALGSIGEDPLRPTLGAIYLNFGPEGLDVVGTDSKEIVISALPGAFTPKQALLPKKTGIILKTILDSKEQDIEVRTDGNAVEVILPSCTLSTRLVAGKYPTYRSVVPSADGLRTLTIPTDELCSALKTVDSVTSGGTPFVKLTLDSLCVTVEGEDIGGNARAQETVSGTYDGEAVVLGFSAKKLLKLLTRVGGEEVSIRVRDPKSAVLITPVQEKEGLSVLAVLMPVYVH